VAVAVNVDVRSDELVAVAEVGGEDLVVPASGGGGDKRVVDGVNLRGVAVQIAFGKYQLAE